MSTTNIYYMFTIDNKIIINNISLFHVCVANRNVDCRHRQFTPITFHKDVLRTSLFGPFQTLKNPG